MRRKRVRLGVSRFQAGTEAPSTNQEIHGRRTSACKGLDVHLYIERQDVVHQLVLARESSTAPVLAPECGWPDEPVSGRVWQILECWRDFDFARGGSKTYELF